MRSIRVHEVPFHEGQVVKLYGWVYNKRESGKIKFLELRDGSGILNCVFLPQVTPAEVYGLYSKLSQESSVAVVGLVHKHPKRQEWELHVQNIEVFQLAQGYPISPKEHGIEFLMDNRHLWVRSRKSWAILRVRHEVIKAIEDFLDQEGFIRLDAPIFTPSACEGTTTLFQTQYFDQVMYLSQSGQLYMEALAAAFGKVYCLGPTFRAEKSKTRRHLLEFWMVEPEMAFATLEDVMDLAERMVAFIVQRVLTNRRLELNILERDLSRLEKIQPPFERLHYKQACEIILSKNPDFRVGDDFGAPDEAIISEAFQKPVFVHHFPKAVKAFYMKEDPTEPGSVLGCDLLAPEGYGEIIGGGQREEDLEKLQQAIKDHQLPESSFQWYLDLRRYGTFPHGGFGLGIERTVAWICGIHHVRETIPFPRLYGRAYP